MIFTFCFTINYMLAEPVLYADVEFNVKSAREYVTDGIKYRINPQKYEDKLYDKENRWNKSNLEQGKTNLPDRTLAYFSDSSYGVVYHDEMNYTYYYDTNGLLIYVDQKEGSGTTYPHRFYKYKANGTLENMGVRVSKSECYIYTPDEKLIAHWIGQNAYDENNRVIMQRQYGN